jgi:hypothetical protein
LPLFNLDCPAEIRAALEIPIFPSSSLSESSKPLSIYVWIFLMGHEEELA